MQTLTYTQAQRGICPKCSDILMKDNGRMVCLSCASYFSVPEVIFNGIKPIPKLDGRGVPFKGEFKYCADCGELIYIQPYRLAKASEDKVWRCNKCSRKARGIPKEFKQARDKSCCARGGRNRAIKLGRDKCREICLQATRRRWAMHRLRQYTGV